MANVLWLFLIPLIWALVARFALKKTVTWKETALQGAGAALLIVIIYAAMAWSNTSDQLIMNGYVTGKEKDWVSCSHSYRCNCRESCSGSGTSKSCSTTCDTCYDHTNDWDWNVSTTVGSLTIDRIDRQGEYEPPRWKAVQIGEPASQTARYTNYIKAAPNSLFNMKLAEQESKTKAALIPAYPKVFDYYRINRVVQVGTNVPNASEWNSLINDSLRELGAVKQVNILVVFVGGQGREYASMLERAWLGGKKNDVTIVVGTDGTKVEWVESFTFGKSSGNGLLAVRLRDRLQGLSSAQDAAKGVGIITYEINHSFTRKKMQDYEYLKSESGPSAKQVFWIIGIVLVLLAIATYLLWKHDVFNEERSYTLRRFYR